MNYKINQSAYYTVCLRSFSHVVGPTDINEIAVTYIVSKVISGGKGRGGGARARIDWGVVKWISVQQYAMAEAGGARASASRRLLEHHASSLSVLQPANWPPSRRREEAQALENLQKRVSQGQIQKAANDGASASTATLKAPRLDNRPRLLQKVGIPQIQ